MLNERQISVRGLIMGVGTDYKVLEFDPWTRNVKVAGGGERAFAHGSWAGAEYHAEAVIPILVRIIATSAMEWKTKQRRLGAAFKPIETGPSVELRWRLRGDTEEYVMFGRPRMVAPKIVHLGRGQIRTGLSFVCPEPTIYSGELHTTGDISLPLIDGGLIAPWTAPLLSTTTIEAGRATLTNRGDRDTGLAIRLTAGAEGLIQPVLTLARPDGIVQSLRINLNLADGDYLDINTAAETITLNGTANRRDYVTGDWPILPGVDLLESGELAEDALPTSDLSWTAGAESATATMSASWRDAWST